MIQLKNLTKTYHNRNIPMINNLSLQLPDKGLIFILGNDSGKEALLNIIGGVDRVTNGEIFINDINISKYTDKKLTYYRNTLVGFVTKSAHLIDDYNVYDNIALSLKLQKKAYYYQNINTILEKLDLKGFGLRKVAELNQFQKQKIAIARALIKTPKIVLVEEPTFNMSESDAEEIIHALKEISKESLVIVTSNDILAAKKYASRIIVLQDGKIVQDTDPIEIIDITKKDSLIKSKLSFKDKLKMAFYNLKHHKILSLLTTLLIILTFLSLGILSTTILYKEANIHSKWLSNSNEKSIYFTHQLINNKEKNSISFQSEDIDTLSSQIRTSMIKSYTNDNITIGSLGLSDLPEYESIYHSHINQPLNIVELTNKNDLINEPIIGQMPMTFDEIVISNFVADYLINYGVNNEDNINYKPNTYQDILNDEYIFTLGTYKKVKIVGIINYNLEPFQDLKEVSHFNEDSVQDKKTINNHFTNMINNKYSLILVKEGFINELNDFFEINRLYIRRSNLHLTELFSKYHSNNEFQLNSIYSDDIHYISGNVKKMQNIFTYLTIILIVVSIVLINYFTFINIKNDKKEIKTLIILGSRKSDLTSIYIFEMLMILLFAFVITSFILYGIVIYLNNYLIKGIYNLTHLINYNIFTFNLSQILGLILGVLIITLTASILPFYKLKKIKITN